MYSEFHDQADAKWIVIRRPFRLVTMHPTGKQPPAGLLAARGLAAHKKYLAFLVTNLLINDINFQHCPPNHGIYRTDINM
jgi:hypothetical protein